MTKFNRTESLDQLIMFINMLQIWNLRYSMRFFIIKCIGFEAIIFSINVKVVSSFKVFNTFDYMFLSIVLLP